MYRDSNGERTSTAVIPIPDMISGGGVIFFGEDPGFIDDTDDDTDEIRDRNIGELSW